MTHLRRAFLLHPLLGDVLYDPSARVCETVALAHAFGLKVCQTRVVRLRGSPLPGKGTLHDIREVLTSLEADVLLFDGGLTGAQQGDLEKALNCPVLDRTALIIGIFAQRARTHEGRLQVELASLAYQKAHLVRRWTHLERQRGRASFVSGPGERQIELDRRQMSERMASVQHKLKRVLKTRRLHRQGRHRPVVALVGYTNAGKSTLFNVLTGAGVVAQDRLFSTLDPTMRLLTLPSGKEVLLSDTVGFLSDLPPQLVKAFHATLEEVQKASLLLHVRDMSHPEVRQQKKAVLDTLHTLGVPTEKVLDVMNKADCVPHPPQAKEGRLIISAKTLWNVESVLHALDDFFRQAMTQHTLTLPLEESAPLAWLYRHGVVDKKVQTHDSFVLSVHLSQRHWSYFQKHILTSSKL